jgi:hypothetical protein
MPGVAIVAKNAPLPHYDCWIDQMSLPRIFGTRLDTIPSAGGYLQADPARVARWRGALPAGLRVGFAWAGNPVHSNDRRRRWGWGPAGILATPGIGFVSLRSGHGQARVRSGPFTTFAGSFETAALIAAVDLGIDG